MARPSPGSGPPRPTHEHEDLVRLERSGHQSRPIRSWNPSRASGRTDWAERPAMVLGGNYIRVYPNPKKVWQYEQEAAPRRKLRAGQERQGRVPRELLIPYALRKGSGALVHVDQVPTGKAAGCICPNCKAPLFAKNRGIIRQHHFAHASPAPGCGEGWLHAIAKMLLLERIESALETRVPVPIEWRCSECSCKHTGDLLRGVDSVSMETLIPEASIRPDILCLGSKPKIVEVVHTHAPERPVRDYAQAQGIPLVVLNVRQVDELEAIKDGTLAPVGVTWDDLCPCERKAQRGESVDCGDWRYCDRCGRVVRDKQGQFGGYVDHQHCASCGDVMTYTEGFLAKHFCCYWTDRFRLPLCHDRDPDHPIKATHGHCTQCGARTGLGYGACRRHYARV